MSKLNFSLTSVFEACRKIFNPTPEERAEANRQHKIKGLVSDMNLAMRGLEVAQPTKEDFYAWGARTASAMTVVHLPYRYESLEGEAKEAKIQELTDKMVALGVEPASIEDLKARIKDDIENPRHYDFPIGF